MDPASISVFTTLLINVIGTLGIFLGWLCLRRHRGDKKAPRPQSDVDPDRPISSFIMPGRLLGSQIENQSRKTTELASIQHDRIYMESEPREDGYQPLLGEEQQPA